MAADHLANLDGAECVHESVHELSDAVSIVLYSPQLNETFYCFLGLDIRGIEHDNCLINLSLGQLLLSYKADGTERLQFFADFVEGYNHFGEYFVAEFFNAWVLFESDIFRNRHTAIDTRNALHNIFNAVFANKFTI
jgi:hypothetical protein